MAYPQQKLSATQLQKYLQETGDFLHLTRSHELSMATVSFEVACINKSSQAKVSILDTGIILFEPLLHLSTKDIVLSSAIHGNETAPIEICNALIKKLVLGELHLENRTLFIFGNPPAINMDQRFVDENLNQLFSGAHSQGQGAGGINKERYRALLLEKIVEGFFYQGNSERFHYDLHTAIRASKNEKFAIYPFIHNEPWDKKQLQFMLACGVNTILFSNSPTTSFSYYSANRFSAHSFTIELGKVKPFGENDMENFVDISFNLQCLISGVPLSLIEYNKDNFNFFEIEQRINRHHQNFSFNFSDTVENFTDFPIGTLIAIDGKQAIKINKAGEAIIFPNADVSIGQRALLTVIPVEINPK